MPGDPGTVATSGTAYPGSAGRENACAASPSATTGGPPRQAATVRLTATSTSSSMTGPDDFRSMSGTAPAAPLSSPGRIGSLSPLNGDLAARRPGAAWRPGPPPRRRSSGAGPLRPRGSTIMLA